MKPVVLGGGAWGMALCCALVAAGAAEVKLWCRNPAAAAELQSTRQNAALLPGVVLPARVQASADLQACLKGTTHLLLVVPSVGVPEVLTRLKDLQAERLPLLLCAKGLGPSGERLSELIKGAGFDKVAVLSGPNHAEEIGKDLPAASVVACEDEALASEFQRLLHSPNLRIYTSTDLVGVELCGVLKNPVAVAAGMCDGLGAGDNAKAALLTRALPEMSRYLTAAGGDVSSLYGLSGLGDLFVTASSPHSRNRAAGEALARGEAPSGPKVVEGLRTAALLRRWAETENVPMPIVSAVDRVHGGELEPGAALRELMQRRPKAEL